MLCCAVPPGVTELSVYLPGSEPWYDVETQERVPVSGPGPVKVAAPIDKIPVFQRGGSIVPRKLRVRRSTQTMAKDPLTLVVALDSRGEAEGALYMDDEHTLLHELQGQFALRRFRMSAGRLTSQRVGGGAAAGAFSNEVERVVVLGQPKKPAAVTGAGGAKLDFSYDAKSKVLTIRKPGVKTDEDWALEVK
jgi:alpha 1,3-glucosidase